MLKTDALPKNTRDLFFQLKSSEELQSLTLVGGTAISLLIGHRASMDLDFCTFEDTLPSYLLDEWIRKLKNQHHTVMDAITPNQKSQFKINTGKNLDDYARDYVIDGVKVTFFAYSGTQQTKAFLASYREKSAETQFQMMSLEGLFAMKALLPEKRQKSRDLFDLWYLLEFKGFDINQLFNIVETYSDTGAIDQTIYALTGEMPIDELTDEGLEPVDVSMTIMELYQYFDQTISHYRQAQAKAMFSH